jgi:hypothetical protein
LSGLITKKGRIKEGAERLPNDPKVSLKARGSDRLKIWLPPQIIGDALGVTPLGCSQTPRPLIFWTVLSDSKLPIDFFAPV